MSDKREEIKRWLSENFSGKYTVDFTDNDEIIINGNIHLMSASVVELKYKFAKVNGDFNLGGDKFPREGQMYHRELETLKNCPEEVKGTFSCHFCYNLKDLIGGPKIVGGDYICSKCNLQTLDGIAEIIGGYIIAFANPNLSDITALNNVTFNKYIDLEFANRDIFDTSTFRSLSEQTKVLNDRYSKVSF